MRLDIHTCHIVKIDVVAEGPGVDHLAATAIIKALRQAHFLCILEGESSRQQFKQVLTTALLLYVLLRLLLLDLFAKEVALAPGRT